MSKKIETSTTEPEITNAEVLITETTLTDYINSLRVPAIPDTPEVTEARVTLDRANAELDCAIEAGNKDATRAAVLAVSAAERALVTAEAHAPKAERISAGQVMADLVCRQGWQCSRERGGVDLLSAAVCYIMEAITGTPSQVPATRTMGGALVKACRLGYITCQYAAPWLPELAQSAAELLQQRKQGGTDNGE